ncbi:MAG: hypothetical protein ACOXZK_01120 [Bacteroidales bacterium]|jgi:hypothetical protein
MNKIDEIVKEFYGQYGLAMHTVQILETGLLELYAIKKYVEDKLTDIEYYEILSNPNKLTLGQLNNKLFILNFIDHETKQNLIKANKYRIFLAHRFWWERDIEFDNQSSLVNLHKEIFSYIHHFNSLMDYIDCTINKMRTDNNLKIEEKMGLTNFHQREIFIKSLISTNKKKK